MGFQIFKVIGNQIYKCGVPVITKRPDLNEQALARRPGCHADGIEKLNGTENRFHILGRKRNLFRVFAHRIGVDHVRYFFQRSLKITGG